MKKLLLVSLFAVVISVKAVNVMVIDTHGNLHQNIEIQKNHNTLQHHLEQVGFDLNDVGGLIVGLVPYNLDIATEDILELQNNIVITLQDREILNYLNENWDDLFMPPNPPKELDGIPNQDHDILDDILDLLDDQHDNLDDILDLLDDQGEEETVEQPHKMLV